MPSCHHQHTHTLLFFRDLFDFYCSVLFSYVVSSHPIIHYTLSHSRHIVFASHGWSLPFLPFSPMQCYAFFSSFVSQLCNSNIQPLFVVVALPRTNRSNESFSSKRIENERENICLSFSHSARSNCGLLLIRSVFWSVFFLHWSFSLLIIYN